QELLAQDVDILYLAALENQLNKDNMENVRGKIPWNVTTLYSVHTKHWNLNLLQFQLALAQ
ncbi:hypothetical protein PZH35_13095, partial [Veillonella atypica]